MQSNLNTTRVTEHIFRWFQPLAIEFPPALESSHWAFSKSIANRIFEHNTMVVLNH